MTARNTREILEQQYIPEPNSGCWIWLGAVLQKTQSPNHLYGRVKWGPKFQMVHRIFYEFYKGKIPKNLSLDHLCRNTLCVNPEHLEPVTHIVNCRRSAPATKTHCQYGHAYDDGFEIYVRNDKHGKQYRRCLTCYRMKYPGTKKIGV